MLDRLQENIVTIRQQDLQLLPALNCTKDVLESVGSRQERRKLSGPISAIHDWPSERPSPSPADNLDLPDKSVTI